jgi:hypothetical protein
MTWATPPHAVSATSVAMTATTATDASGVVEYEFNEPNRGSSGWRSDPCYVVTGLNPSGTYCYSVRARDKYSNATAWSGAVCVSHLGDSNAPSPAPTIVVPLPGQSGNLATPDTNDYSGQFYLQYDPHLPWWHKVIVDVTDIVDDSLGPVEIRFFCSDGSLSSDNKIPAAYRPIIIGQPVALGSLADGWRLTYTGTYIVYDVDVNQHYGSGRTLTWRVCAYDEAMNEICSGEHTIGPSF